MEAPPGEISEIAIPGNLFDRYDRMPAETEEDVRDGFFRTDYKCPGRIHFVKEVPKTPAGKIVKAELRRRYAS